MTETRSIFMEKEDIVLRPVEKEDAEFMQESVNHNQIRSKIGRAPKPLNKKQQRENIGEYSDENRIHFIIEFKDEKVGHIMLGGLKNDYGRSYVGYFVIPEYQGQGIGTKSLQLIVKYAFETLNLHKIRGGYLEGNDTSRKVMENSGFQEEGYERHYKYVDGEWKNIVWMSILESEYK